MADKKVKNQNPLLQPIPSFADFTHNAILLSPAPAIVKPAVQTLTSSNTSVLPDDSDTFSEISLDTKPDPIESNSSPRPLYSSLDSLNSSNEDTISQSLSSGLTASFAQLPTVASTVFSTFSRVIKGDSTDQVGLQEHQGLVDQTYTQPIKPEYQDPNPLPPTFFSPNDPSLNTTPPTFNSQSSNSSNTFRLGTKKKKTYAHIPGLSTSAAASISEFQSIGQTAAPVTEIIPNAYTGQVQPILVAEINQINSHQHQSDPSRFPEQASGKFSLSSLIPSASNLLQKVSGVKDLAQNIKEVVAPEPIPVSTNFESSSYFEVTSQSIENYKEPSIAQQVDPINYNFNVNPILAAQQQSQDLISNQTSISSPIENSPAFYCPSTIPTVPKGTIQIKSGSNPYSNNRFGKSAVYKNPALIPSTKAHKSDLLQSETTGALKPALTPAEFSDSSSYKGLSETNLPSRLRNQQETLSTNLKEDHQQQTLFVQEHPEQTFEQFQEVWPQEPTPTNLHSHQNTHSLASFFGETNPADKIDAQKKLEQKVQLNTKIQDPLHISKGIEEIFKPKEANNPDVFAQEPSIVQFHTLNQLQQPEKTQEQNEVSDTVFNFGAVNETSQLFISYQNTIPLESLETNHTNQKEQISDQQVGKPTTESFSDLPKSYPPPLETVNQQDIFGTETLIQKDLSELVLKAQDSRDKLNNVKESAELPRFTPVNFFIDSPEAITPTTENNNCMSANTGNDYFNNNVQGSHQQISNFFDQPAEQNSFSFFRNSSDTQEYQIRPEATHTIDSYSSFRSESISELNQDIDYDEIPTEMSEEVDTASTSRLSTSEIKYRPVYYHWFYYVGSLSTWKPFSMNDSMLLEEVFLQQSKTIVHTDGGRFDVHISERHRIPVYWKDEPSEVRRCSWFYKSLDSKFIPYEEAVADKLEEEFKNQTISGEWHKKVPLPNGDTVVFHGPTVIVHFLQSQNPDSWGNPAQPTNRPRIVKRGFDEFSIEDGEPEQIDHLLFMVHGIGKACDLKFRTIEEAVDEYRSIAFQLVQSHYRTSCDLGAVGRVEVLPISWHAELHSEEIGIDEKIKLVTLESIPKLRTFANETLLDILFYSSPVYCQQIANFVGNSMNRLHTIFKKRNPNFCGQVSLGGHSLGSLILFDLLSHQKERGIDDYKTLDEGAIETSSALSAHPTNYKMGTAGTGQPYVTYPQLNFKPKKFFALGSPISMFAIVRGIHTLGLDFKLPTCEGFYNIFHPFDPVAYRCEPLINPELNQVKPVVISHHKGRKRMHLELRETMARVSADIKQKVVSTFKTTIQAMYPFKRKDDEQCIEHELNKALEEQELKLDSSHDDTSIRKRSDSISTTGDSSDIDPTETDRPVGLLNNGKRIDYVLQEAPLEFFNEYLFALTSHVCYWESEDTILFMMKEIYSSIGIQTDSQIPQHTMTIERPSSSNITPTK